MVVVVAELKELPHWQWFEVVYFWEYGEKGPLANLVVSSSIPDPLKPMIKAIVAGERLPSKKKAATKIIQKQMTNTLISHASTEKLSLIILKHRLSALTQLYDTLIMLDDIKTNQIELQIQKLKTTRTALLNRLTQDETIAFKRAKLALGLSTQPIQAAYNDFERSILYWLKLTG